MRVEVHRLVRVKKIGHLVEVIMDFREAGGEETSEESSRTCPAGAGGKEERLRPRLYTVYTQDNMCHMVTIIAHTVHFKSAGVA